ncbi:MAG TPA: hypothetical protein VLB44_22445, partial [Kofleriaceae bacterium]|nr:hypothetical protein [Kofleriaceae bacterium]
MKMNFAGRLHGIGHALARLPRLIHANEPTFEVPRAPPHRLGELLVAHGRLAATDIEDALRLQEGTEVLFGEVISASGMMCSRDVIEALGANLDIPYAEPNAEDVPLALLQKLPESLAAALEAMPVAILDDGQCVIAMARAARSEETQRLVDVLGGPVRMVLAERNAIRRGRWRAYRRLIEPQRSHQRLGEALITAGALDIAQLD